METLTTQETVRLCELERIIQKGKDTFVEVGTALAEIRDAKLYKPKQTFEEYCKERWDFSYRRAVQMIEAAATVKNMNQGSHSMPTTERQARPLAKLPPEDQPAAWEKAQELAKEEGKPVAARHVEAAVEEVMPKKEPEPEIDPVVVDGTQDQNDNQKKGKIDLGVPCSGMEFWAMARSQLQRINKKDKERVQALEACIKYCKERISNKK
jgi:hypothetical protein